jgi:hypothetical protein
MVIVPQCRCSALRLLGGGFAQFRHQLHQIFSLLVTSRAVFR